MKKFLLFFFSISMGIANAQWIGDSTLNNGIATGNLANSRNGLVSVPTVDGGMYLAWEDTTNPATIGADIYLQKINADGTVAFATGGLAVCSEVGAQTGIAMISDGAGGVVLAWQDQRFSTSNGDIFGQRVLANGTFGWAAGGIALTVDTVGNQTVPTFTVGNSGEIIMFYRSNNAATTQSFDLFVNKITISTGVATAAKLIAGGANVQTAQTISSDGTGGAFLLWQDPYRGTADSDIQMQRVNNSLDTLWSGTGANGITICNATANQLAPSMAVDATGVTVAWGDLRAAPTNSDIYAQRVNYSGVIQWTSNGVAVCNATGNQTNVNAVRSNGGVILVWGDNRVATNNRDIYAQKISNVDGSAMWTVANGTPISTPTGNQPNSTTAGFNVFSDNANGAYIVWDDARKGSSDLDIRAQLINSNGATQWTIDGTAVAVASGSNQNQPTSVATAGGIIVAWRDSRTATSAEIFASRLASTGLLVLPVRFLNVKASIKNNEGLVQWKVAGEVNVARYEIEKSSNGLEFEIVGTVKATRVDYYDFVDRKLLLGNNFYRIKAVDKDGKTSYSDVALLKQNVVTAFTISVLPNPAVNDIKVQATNLEEGNYSIRIVQNNGSVIKEQRFNSNKTFTTITVPLQMFAKGAYTLIITNSKGENIYSTQIQKL